MKNLLLSHTRHHVPGIAAVYSVRYSSSSPDVIKDD